MSFTQWDTFSTGSGGVTFTLEVGSPLVDATSLKMVAVDDAAGTVLPSDSGGLSHGFTVGRLRTIVELTTLPGSFGASFISFGIVAMQSQDDVTTTGNAYNFALHMGAGGSPQSFNLNKIVGLDGSGFGTNLDTLAITPFTAGSIFTMEFEWIEAVSEIGGVQLTGKTGTATDFSDLSTVVSALDTTSPYTTSVGEGLFSKISTVSGTSFTVLFDTTELFTSP